MTAEVSPSGTTARETAARSALAALDAADVVYALRNGDLLLDDPAADLDVLVHVRDHRRVHRALLEAGWHRLRAPGHRGHHFFLREADDLTWVKLDVVTEVRYGSDRSDTGELLARRRRVEDLWVVSADDVRGHAAHRAAGHREEVTTGERLARALPLALRRRGCTVAVLGPDGAGKGTVTEGVAATLPVAVTRVYLGDRRAQPATAAGDPAAASTAQVDPATAARTVREIAFLLRKLARWTPDLVRASVAAWRGHVVLTDRHPLDALAVQPPRTPWGVQVERLLATHVVPSPDAIVVLDAPGWMLYGRKGEHTPELLERWRQGYRECLGPRGAAVVDATGPVDRTVDQVRHIAWRALSSRRGWSPR